MSRRLLTKEQATKSLESRIYDSYKQNSVRKNLRFDISREELLYFTRQNCHYCGAEPSNLMRRKKDRHPFVVLYSGLDRKDNGRGYTVDNVVPCCHNCNQIKSDSLSYEEMIFISKQLKIFRLVQAQRSKDQAQLVQRLTTQIRKIKILP